LKCYWSNHLQQFLLCKSMIIQYWRQEGKGILSTKIITNPTSNFKRCIKTQRTAKTSWCIILKTTIILLSSYLFVLAEGVFCMEQVNWSLLCSLKGLLSTGEWAKDWMLSFMGWQLVIYWLGSTWLTIGLGTSVLSHMTSHPPAPVLRYNHVVTAGFQEQRGWRSLSAHIHFYHLSSSKLLSIDHGNS
jgi:hypothetical protein